MSTQTETWKDIEGYEGLYQVSDLGNIKSLFRINYRKDGSKNPVKERVLKTGLAKSGYLTVSLSKDYIAKSYAAHRLVLSTFKSNPDCKPTVNHKDGDKKNNNLSNLD